MTRKLFIALLALALSASYDDVFARGGGRGGGGFGGGGGRGGFGGGGGSRSYGGGGGFSGGGGGRSDFGGGGFSGGGGRSDFGGGGFSGGGGRSDFGGGGFSGGGGRSDFGGGGFSGGGGFNAGRGGGGFDANRAGAGGGFNAGRGAAGGYGGGGFDGGRGAAPSRSQLNSFLGMPSDGGLSSGRGGGGAGNNFTVNRGSVEGPRGGEAGGVAVTGPRGNTAAKGAAVGPNGGVAVAGGVQGAGGATAGRGVAVGPNGGVAAGNAVRGPNGGEAARGVAVGPNGGVAAGSAVRGPNGGEAARGVAVGPNGGVAAGSAVRGPYGGYAYRSAGYRYGQGYAVRGGFAGYGLYTRSWYADHPGAWVAAGLTASAWNAATWNSLYGWCGATSTPVYYNYGDNVVVQGDSVYVDGQDTGTTQAYYDQAASIAQAGAQGDTQDDANWLPLGVFAMTQADKNDANMSVQLAVDKAGVVRGNFTDSTNDKTLPVKGSVDKSTQRVAWTIGDKTDEVMETGLYNLTKDEAPALLHYGKDRTEQWTLVRLNAKRAPQPGGPAAQPAAPSEETSF